MVAEKLKQCLIHPGAAIGIVTAQSLGEPCTQMTLKTFHFAGVSAMNITLGVPRIKEIFNQIQKIKAPIISVNLVQPENKLNAIGIFQKIRRLTLSEILIQVNEVYNHKEAYLELHFNWNFLNKLQDFDLNLVK